MVLLEIIEYLFIISIEYLISIVMAVKLQLYGW